MGTGTDQADRLVAGRYALSDVLGRGGMGVVWLATDRLLERQVAVKELTFPAELTDEERSVLRERTLREARAAARLDHPCVIRLYDVVQEQGKPWLVMEHVPSRSLQQILEDSGPLPPLDVARIGLDVLAALEAAHRAGIVHRDVKPSNVLVDRDGRACLTDFGIATTTGDSSLTTAGALIGSPSYMAPERAGGEEPRPAVDLWSLGATLYTAVEGRPPYDRGEPMATLMAVVTEEPGPMARAGALEPVLRGLLTKDPAARSTAEQARRQLEDVLRGVVPPPPPDPPQAAALTPMSAPPAGPPGPPPAQPAGPPPRPHPARTGGRNGGSGVVRGGSLQRFDVDDLRALASASRVVIGTVAHQARSRVERRREAESRSTGRPPARPAPAPARWRFKRRWVVVPLLIVVLLTVAAVAGIWWMVAAMLGQV